MYYHLNKYKYHKLTSKRDPANIDIGRQFAQKK